MKRQGFTLIELVVVIAILGVILSFFMPNLREVREQTLQQQLTRHIDLVEKNLRQYYAIHGYYPDTLVELKKDGFGFVVQADYVYSYTVDQKGKDYTLNISKP